ncbi:MAG: hypothetical protein Q9P01_01710 [Anaerolineae bacterium]|nr:hypothetical protein [Anaerolineae bacterium]MDQ7033578.1 hypothetical protein [Anaerolineae bacterium]
MLNPHFITNIARKYALPIEVVRQLASELEKTGGQSVRFDIKGLGGKGLWRINQAASVGNGFNTALNEVVTDLCNDISTEIHAINGAESEASTMISKDELALKVDLDDTVTLLAPTTLKPKSWWPEHYGQDPEKTGNVTGMRFAYFAQQRRLILSQGLRNRIFDTGDYNVQNVVAGQESGFFNLIVLTIEGDIQLADLPEVAQ